MAVPAIKGLLFVGMMEEEFAGARMLVLGGEVFLEAERLAEVRLK
jgi:hypothetical protein